MLSYDLHVFDGKRYDQAYNSITPIEDFNIFDPKQLSTDQWVKAAKDAGAKFAILTVTHETGFALYQSDINLYCLKAVKWKNSKGDIVKDFIKSCKKYDILPGLFIGIRWNSFFGVYDFKVVGDNQFAKNRQTYYNSYCEKMTEELTSRYGKLLFIWFDCGANGPQEGGPNILPIVEKNQPDAIFYHNLQRADVRWCGCESGIVPYPCWGMFNQKSWFKNRGDDVDFKPIKYGYADGKFYCPAMADAPLRGYKGRHEWFWEPNDESHIFPLENLLKMYDASVGHNATLILGLTPDADGLIPALDVDTLRSFGNKIKERYGLSITETPGQRIETILEAPADISLNAIAIEEDVKFGQRIREFSVLAMQNGTWKEIITGTSIGHKFINRFSEPLKCEQLKLIIFKSEGKAMVKPMAVY